ncbi:hypothetical protein DNTS_002229 [Danionella cerebrum]|uniref:Uroporphyrinogen-III synthase n=1 Tax=Danionella cerebrum TaxID=2873325 RepID=A0A553NGS9_9TELE|nr:hypothetical protein DNTS_002229 [Danionella translucida]
MKVLLLKEPRETGNEPDQYIKELALCGHTATLIPVLSFTFVGLDELSQRLLEPERFGGLIFTSPRAVEAVRICLQSQSLTSEWDAVKERWNAKSIYVVGKATASLVVDLGLCPMGEDSGTAEKLALIIQQNIPLETLTVYKTSPHPDLEKNITDYFTQQGVPASVAFFSPSGVSFCLELLKSLSGSQLEQIKVGAPPESQAGFVSIGPSTAEALQAKGLTLSCSAEKPSAGHLAQAITRALCDL